MLEDESMSWQVDIDNNRSAENRDDFAVARQGQMLNRRLLPEESLVF
jgi:hypothetical protein